MNDLEQLAIERLKAASEMSLLHYGQPLIITDSGGKMLAKKPEIVNKIIDGFRFVVKQDGIDGITVQIYMR